jgi:hypothetical protein
VRVKISTLLRLVPQTAGTRTTADKAEEATAESDDKPDPPENLSVVVPCPGLLLGQIPNGRESSRSVRSTEGTVAITRMEQVSHGWRSLMTFLSFHGDCGGVARGVNAGVDNNTILEGHHQSQEKPEE